MNVEQRANVVGNIKQIESILQKLHIEIAVRRLAGTDVDDYNSYKKQLQFYFDELMRNL